MSEESIEPKSKATLFRIISVKSIIYSSFDWLQTLFAVVFKERSNIIYSSFHREATLFRIILVKNIVYNSFGWLKSLFTVVFKEKQHYLQ